MKFESSVENKSITLRGPIADAEGCVSSDEFITALAEHEGDITLHLNSEGGVVTEGLSIFNAIDNYDGNVTVVVDTIAASIATVICCAADKVVMNANAKFMIHRAWTVAAGNCLAFRATAEIMEMMDADIAAAYSEKTGLDEVEILDMMSAETWFTAKAALKAGFVDEVNPKKKSAKQPKAEAEGLSLFANVQASRALAAMAKRRAENA